MDVKQLTNDLVSLDNKVFRRAKLHHSIKLCKFLYDNADGVTTNLVETCITFLNGIFKNPKTRDTCLNKLKEGGIIENTDSYIVGSKCKTYRLSNKYLPVDKQSKYTIQDIMKGKEFLNDDGSVNEDIFFKAVPGPKGYDQMFGKEDSITVTFKFKGFGDDLTYTITKQQKETVKEIFEMFGANIHEQAFIDACSKKDIDGKLAWYLYSKKLNKSK